MLSKNNQHEQIRKRSQRNYHYAIKNLKIGVFSVAVSVGLSFLGQGAIVQAAELQAADTLPSSATVVDENAKENKSSQVQPEAVHAETPASNTQASAKPAEVQPEAQKPAQTGQAAPAQAEASKPAKTEPTAEVQPVSDEKDNKVSKVEKAASPQAEKPVKEVAQPEKEEEKPAPKQDAASENSEVRAVNYEGDSAVTYTSLDKVQLPEYAGIFSHDYFNEGKNVTSQAEIADFVKEALRDKGLGDDVTYTVDKASFDQALARTGGPSRVENSGDIIVTLKQGNVSKTIKVRALYFRPSYTSWEKDLTKFETPHSKPDKKDYYKKDDHVRSSHSSHNVGKLNVADPNNYTLTEAEKNKIINDFKAVNTNLGLKDPKYSVDDKGNLTITEGDFSTVIPRDYFISNFGFVKDILVFHKEGVNEAYPLTNPIKVPVRNDKEYKDLWGANGTGIGNKGYPSKFKYAIQKDKDGNKFLVLSGTYNKSNNEPRKKDGKYEVWGKYGIGSHADKPQDYFQSFTNFFRVRVLRTKNGTIIKNLDTEKITPEELEKAVGVDYKKLNALNSPDDPKGTTDAQVRAAVKARITEEFDASGLKHQIGIQNFTGRAIADKHKDSDRFNEENISNEFVATAIYYSEKIKETLVNDPANLNPNEIASIKAKIKERNKALGLTDDDITVDQSGNISIRIKDPNSKEKDGKTTVKFTESAPLVTASYPEKTVQAGNTVTSAITPSKKDDPNYKFPEGTKFELPSGQGAKNPVGLTVDPKTGEITYKAPADAEEKDVEGTINVTLPGEDKPTPIPYLIHVQRPSYAKVRYVTSDGKDIDPKFRAEAEDKYPSEIEGKRDSRVIEYAGQKDFAAPKFVGYVFERPQVNGQNQSFNPQKDATLELVYRKLDEIIPADSGQGKPDGYVKVTFKDVEGGKLDQADADKVYFVNPKAGVKISEDGANLVGKDKDGKEQKVALPKVSPDEKYEVNYHKPSADETTTWAYDKYDQVGKEITEDKEFTAQVVKQQKEEFEPKYDDKTGTPGEEVPVEKPSFTDKDGNPTQAPEGTKYELGKDTPEGVTVNPDGSLSVKVPEGAKDGDVITVPVKVTYPDGTSDTVNAKVTVKDQSQTVEPKYKDKVGTPGSSVKVDQPEFTGKDGKTTPAPEGAKYELGKDTPQGVTVNPDGSLTVKVPEGAKDGDVITVPVKVTYPDGTSDTVNAKVTVSDQSQTFEPKYKDKVGKPGEEVPVEKPAFSAKDGNPTKAPEGTKYELGKDAPQGVTVNPDGSLTVKVPEGAKDGDVITVPVKGTYPDGTSDTVNAKVTVSDQSQTVEPKYKDKVGKPGEEVPVEKPAFSAKDGNPTKAPEGTKYELGKDAPQGVTVNPDGSLTVKVPEGAKDGDVITVPVKVTYPDGTSDAVNAKVTVKDQSQTVEPKYNDKVGTPGSSVKVNQPEFTGKDGKTTPAPEGTKYELGKDTPQGVTVNPDGSLTVKVPEGAKDGDVITVPVKVTYPDGTSDTVNAKVTVKDQSQTVEPKYNDKVGTPGSSVKVDQPEFTGKDGKTTPAPEGTKYELGKDAPQGVTVEPDGSLTVKVPEGAKDGDVITVPVKVTYPDGTSDTVNAKVTVKDQSQTVEPKYKDKVGIPGSSVKVDQPEFTGKDGKTTPAPEGTKYELGKDAPQGVTVNPDGSLTVKVPDGAKDGDEITVPVKVTYPDGTSDTVNAKVTVKDQSQTVEPKYKDKVGTPGSSVKVDQPEFTGKDGKTTPAPEGAKYELGKDAPQGVTVNPDGSLTVKVPEGAKDGDEITVPVKVTYPDGTTDTVNAKVTVSDQSQTLEPKYKDKTGTPGEEVPVEQPSFTDKDGNPTKAPEGTKYELGKDAPQGVTVNPDGSLTVKAPEGAKDGDVITVPVKVTYPDGTTDTVNAKVTVSDQSQTVEPKYEDKTGTPGEEVPVEKPSFTDKDGNPTKTPEGAKYELGKDAPQGAIVKPDGSLTVKVPEGAKDGDVITVPVKVTYPDGTSDTVNAKVTVSDQSQTVEPKYKDKVGKPGEEVPVEKPAFSAKDGNPTEAPEGTKYELGKDAPQGVIVKPDGSLTVKVPEGAKDGDVITVPVKVTYPDGTSDTVNAKVTVKDQSQTVEPKYKDKEGTPGQEVPVEKPTFADKADNPTTAPEGTKYELGKDTPQGVTVNPDGSLTVKVPKGAKDGDVITVPVKATYPDGTSDTVNAKVTVKDQSQTVEPKYKDKVGKPGEEVPVEQPSFTDKNGNPTKAPEGTKYELGKDAPQGVTVNPDGSLKVKVPEGAKDGDVITVPVKVTYPDGTSDTVNAKVTVSDQSQTVEPKYKDKVGIPGSSVKVDQPNFTDKEGNPTKAPEGTKYELGKDAPQGITVNPDGSLKVKVPEGAKDGDVITVPVKVTYPDGTSDTVNAKVTVSDQSQTVEPKYKDKVGKPGQEVPVEQPNFTDKEGNPTKAPEGTKYELGKDAPQGITVNPDGSITVKVPEGAKDGDVITVPVKVTYPDGTSDTVNAKLTVSDQSQKIEPKYKDKTGIPGQEVPVEKPSFTDKDGKTTPASEGTKYELGKDAPQGVTVNPDGSLTVKVPEGAKDGDVITVPVKVTYPDGTSDTVNAKVTVKDQSQTVEPKYKDKVGTPGSSVKVDQPEFTGKDGKTTPAPEGTKYELGKDAPQGVTVNPDGSLTVKVPEGAKDGDVITVPVKVTYPDGTSDTVNAKVTVKDQSQTVEPKYKDKVGTPGSSVKVDQPEFTGKDGKTTPAPEGTKYELGKDAPQGVTVNPDGSLTVKVPEGAKDGDVITVPVKVTYPDGTTDTVEAKITVSDQSQKYTPKPVITLVDDLNKITKEERDQAIKSLKDFNKDLPKDTVITIDKDGNAIFTYPDGTADLIEKDKVFAERETTLPPVFNKVKEGDKEISGKTEAFAKVIVTIPGLEKPVEVTADEDGNFTVSVPDGVTLKVKDKITAIAQGKDKKVSRLGEVLVEEIPTAPLPCPSSPEPANPSPEPSQPSAPQLEDKDHPSQTTETDHSQPAKTDHSTETIVKEGTQTAATASPNLSRVEEKEESQTEKAAQTENANTSLPKTGVVAAPVALELLLVAAGAILALPSKRKNK